MALYYERDEVHLERDSISVTVPENDIARLMFYLHCVCTSIDCNNDAEIQRFTNYNRWNLLSIDEQKVLIVLCYRFSPDVFDDKVFFHSEALCEDSSNRFYKIHQVRSQLLAAESIVIAGQVRHVNKIMTYKMSWMKTYYLDPMTRLATRLSSPPPRPAIQSRPARSYSPPVVRQPARTSSSGCRCTACRVCSVLFCLSIIIAIIIAIVISNRKGK